MNAPFRLQDQEYGALISIEAASEMLRERLSGHVRGIQQSIMLAAMNKSKMIGFIEQQAEEGGTGAVIGFIETVCDFARWAGDMAQIAKAIEARVICAAAKVVDMPPDEPDPADEVDPHRAWLEERDTALAYCNSDAPGPDLPDEDNDALVTAFVQIENRILTTAATTLDGVAVKLLVLGQLAG